MKNCTNCGKPMVVKNGQFGNFLACSGYPECKTTEQIKDQVNTGEPAQPSQEATGKPEVSKEVWDAKDRLYAAQTSFQVASKVFAGTEKTEETTAYAKKVYKSLLQAKSGKSPATGVEAEPAPEEEISIEDIPF